MLILIEGLKQKIPSYKYAWWTTMHHWCGGHFTSINVCGVLGARARVQVSKKELHTYTPKLN